MKTKEEIYDEQISPLMKQILDICKQNGIAHVSSFCLDLDEGFLCTSALTTKDFNTPVKFKECVNILYDRNDRPPLMITTHKADGTTEVAAIFP